LTCWDTSVLGALLTISGCVSIPQLVSLECIMTTRDPRVNGWAQSSLLPPEHVRILVSVHFDADADKVQVGVSVTEYVEEVTLGVYTACVPFSGTFEAVEELASALLKSALSEHCGPF
jgi:hypothetical protein